MRLFSLKTTATYEVANITLKLSTENIPGKKWVI